MWRLLVIPAFFVAGCCNVGGPLRPVDGRPVDDPCLPISEQEKRGRARYAYPDETPQAGPLTGIGRPYTHDR